MEKQIKLKLTLNYIADDYSGGVQGLLNDIKQITLVLSKSIDGFSLSGNYSGKFTVESKVIQNLNELKTIDVKNTNNIQIGRLKAEFLNIDDSLYDMPNDANISGDAIEITFSEDSGGGDDDGEETSLLFSEYKRRMYERNLPVDIDFCEYCFAKYDSTLNAYIPYMPQAEDTEMDEGGWNVNVDFLGVDLFPSNWEWDSEAGQNVLIPAVPKTLYYKQVSSDSAELETVGYNNYFTPEFYHIGYKYKWKPVNEDEHGVSVDWEYIYELEQAEDFDAIEEYKQSIVEQTREAVENLYSTDDYYVNVSFGMYDLSAQVISKDIELLSQAELDEDDIKESDQHYGYDEETDMNIGIQLVSVLESENKGSLLGVMSPYTYNHNELLSNVLTLRVIPLTQQVEAVYNYNLSSVELDGVNYQYARYDNFLYGIDDNGMTISDYDLYFQNGTEDDSATVTKVEPLLTGYSRSGWINRGDYAKFEYDYFYGYCFLINDDSEISSVIAVKPSNNPVYQDSLDSLILSRSFRDTLPKLWYCKSLNPWLYYSSSQLEMKGIGYKYKTMYNNTLHGYIFGSPVMKTTPQNISRMYAFDIYFGGAYNADSESSSYLKLLVYNVTRADDMISSVRNVYCDTEEITNESQFSFSESSSYPYRFLFLECDEDSNITNLLALHNSATSSDDFDNITDLTNLLTVVLGKSSAISYSAPERVARADYSTLTDSGSNFTTVPYYYKQTVVQYPSIGVEKIGFFKNGVFVEINDVTLPDSSSSLINIPKSSNPQLSINDKIFTVYRRISDY